MARFFKCDTCGNIVGLIHEGGGTLVCCGKPMRELIAATDDTQGHEKHVPVVHEEKGKVYVQVGSIPHPMEPDHFIEWVYLLTDQGAQRKQLKPGMEPKVIFNIAENEVVLEVFAYCNKHGLWKAKLD